MPPSTDDVIARRALRRLGASLCGRYSILRLIGIGGMAAVYAGVHRNGHAVAIKVLHEQLATDPEIERLFRREAQLANKIDHPGVVPVIDDDVTEDGCIFLVMPLLEGETIRARAERLGRKLPVEEVIVVAHAVLGALEAAHAKKIVHRDIKPENIFLTRGGDVQVLDFGIGRFFETPEHATATRTGRAVGTPAFMAPEQALGRQREIDGRTDLWALGATMFTLLSGRFVHEAESASEIAVLAATRPPRALGEVAPEVAEAVRGVVDRALSFKKEERWSDAGEMAQGLLRACEAALGVGVAELPRIRAPFAEHVEGVDGVPTRAPEVTGGGEAGERGKDDERSDSERFRGAPTRTTGGGAVVALGRLGRYPLAQLALFLSPRVRRQTGAGVPRAGLGAPPRLGTLGIALSLGLLILAGIIMNSGRRVASPTGKPEIALTPVHMTLTDLANTSFPDAAVLDYKAGLQLWRDGSPYDGAGKFISATANAPGFAAAHLWFLVAAAYVDTAVRQHYASALLYRETLTDSQSRLLEALAPNFRDPPDFVETAKRLERLSDSMNDPLLSLILATRYFRLGDTARGLEIVDQVISSPAPPTLAFYLRALLLSLDDRAGEVRLALRACADRSPPGRSCLEELWNLEAQEGHCAEIAPICHKLLATGPNSATAYSCFVDAFSSTESTLETTRSAYEEKERRTRADILPATRAEDAMHLAILEGRLSDAENAAGAWRAAEDGPDGEVFVRLAAYEMQTGLNVELQRKRAAVRLVQSLENESRAWGNSNVADVDGTKIFLRSQVGLSSPAEREIARELISGTADDQGYMWPAARWYSAYVRTAWSADEASSAIAHLPARGFFPPQYRDAETDYRVGQVFALAGDRSRAIISLKRAAHSCTARTDFERTLAKVALAALSEDSREEACKLYAEVLSHWRNAPESASMKMARERSHALHCAG